MPVDGEVNAVLGVPQNDWWPPGRTVSCRQFKEFTRSLEHIANCLSE